MRFKMVMNAAFRMKNLALLAAVAIVSYITGYLPFTFIGMAGYIYFTMQTLKSDEFIKEFNDEEKLDSLERMSDECIRLFKKIKHNIDYNSRSKVVNVLKQMQELMEFFRRDTSDSLNRKIIEQALSLAISYMQLIYNFSTRYKELSSIDTRSIAARINRNNRKLGNLKSYDAVLELTKAVEMDEKLLLSIQEEKNELENTNAKLDHIESMIAAFKHQIISAEFENPAVEDIESVINEAAALDNVLKEKRRQKL